AQDRCHRIGQTREVHIYRLISEKTIEENILLKSDQKRHLDFLAIQSGGFNPDALRRFSPQDLFSISGKAETQGPSADDIKAAMRDAEDEGDAAAAAALEQEAAADLAEFNADPVPAAAAENDGDDEDAEPEDGRDEAVPASGDGSAAAQAGAQPPAAEPALAERQPSAAMDAGGGVDEAELGVTQLMEGAGRDSNALAQLEASLRPIERYAVRVVEETHPGLAPSAVEDVPEPAMPQEQWSLQELERIEAEQEAEAEEEGGAAAIADWDKAAADAAYQEEVERALEQQRLWEADQAKQAAALQQEWEELQAQQAAAQAAAAPRALSMQQASKVPAQAWKAVSTVEVEAGMSKRMRKDKKMLKRQRREAAAAAASGIKLEAVPFVANRKRSIDELPQDRSKKARFQELPRLLDAGRIKREGQIPNGRASSRGRPQEKSPGTWLPWETNEDFILVSLVQQALVSLAAAPASTAPANPTLSQTPALAAATSALLAGRMRTPRQCEARFAGLIQASRAAAARKGPVPSSLLTRLRHRLAAHLAGRACTPESIAMAMAKATMCYDPVQTPGGKEVTARAATNAARQVFQQLAALLGDPKSLSGADTAAEDTVSQATPAEATNLLQSVRRVCGGAARGLSKQLGPLTASLNSGSSIREVNADLIQRLQPPKPQPKPAALLPHQAGYPQGQAGAQPSHPINQYTAPAGWAQDARSAAVKCPAGTASGGAAGFAGTCKCAAPPHAAACPDILEPACSSALHGTFPSACASPI
ncbi:hypothetical protein WJX84_001837, partial [Apatococcus fuscideae]